MGVRKWLVAYALVVVCGCAAAPSPLSNSSHSTAWQDVTEEEGEPEHSAPLPLGELWGQIETTNRVRDIAIDTGVLYVAFGRSELSYDDGPLQPPTYVPACPCGVRTVDIGELHEASAVGDIPLFFAPSKLAVDNGTALIGTDNGWILSAQAGEPRHPMLLDAVQAPYAVKSLAIRNGLAAASTYSGGTMSHQANVVFDSANADALGSVAMWSESGSPASVYSFGPLHATADRIFFAPRDTIHAFWSAGEVPSPAESLSTGPGLVTELASSDSLLAVSRYDTTAAGRIQFFNTHALSELVSDYPLQGQDLAIGGSIVYVALGSVVHAISLADPDTPTLVGRLKTPSHIRAIAATEGVFALAHDQRVAVYLHEY